MRMGRRPKMLPKGTLKTAVSRMSSGTVEGCRRCNIPKNI
jgi:hypothetical protein